MQTNHNKYLDQISLKKIMKLFINIGMIIIAFKVMKSFQSSTSPKNNKGGLFKT
jgi:hypothetical protein